MRLPRFQFQLTTLFIATAVFTAAAWGARYHPTPFVLFIVIGAALSPFCTILACTAADLRHDGYRPPRFQFYLRSLFIFTAVVALACLVGPPIATNFKNP